MDLPSVSWSLLNLIFISIDLIFMLILLIVFYMNRSGDHGSQKRLWSLLATTVLALLAVALFLLTENQALPMALINQFTIWHIIITTMVVIFSASSLTHQTQIKSEEMKPSSGSLRNLIFNR